MGVDAGAVATLRREAGGAEDFADALAEAWVKGVRVDWTQRYPDSVEIDLPSYPFQRSSYWLPEKSHETDLASAGLSDGGHPWLAVSTDLPDGSTVRPGRPATATDPWLADHAVFGEPWSPRPTWWNCCCTAPSSPAAAGWKTSYCTLRSR